MDGNLHRTPSATELTVRPERIWKPVRVAHVIGDGRHGGGTSFVLNLTESLLRHGIDSIVVSQQGSYLLEQARSAGRATIGLDFSGRGQALARTALGLARSLKEAAPALLHVHGARAGFPVVLSGSWTRIPMVYTVHGLHFHHKRGLGHIVGRMVESSCFRCARETVFVSPGDREFARLEGILNHTRCYGVLPNAVPPLDLAEFQPDTTSKTHDIIFVGRLEFQKNPLLLADILIAMRPARPRVCIVGGGSLEVHLRQRLEALGVADQVVWRGLLDHSEALHEMAHARVMVLPSRWEGLPLCVIEAMQLGLPVVASNVAGIADLVAEGQTGYLVHPEDAASYASRIQLLLSQEKLQQRMGLAGRKRIATDFSFTSHVRQHVDLYRRHFPKAPGRSGPFVAANDSCVP